MSFSAAFQQDLGGLWQDLDEDPTDQLSFSQLANQLLPPDGSQRQRQWDDDDAVVRELRVMQRAVNNDEQAPFEVSDDEDSDWRDPGEPAARHWPAAADEQPAPAPHRLYGHGQPQLAPSLAGPSQVIRPVARYAPVPDSSRHAGATASRQPHKPAFVVPMPLRQPAKPKLKLKNDTSVAFPLPLNGNTNRRKDEHLRPAGGPSRFQPALGGDYSGAQGDVGRPNGSYAQVPASPAPVATRNRVDNGKGKARAVELDQDEDLFGDDDEFERALAESGALDQGFQQPPSQPQRRRSQQTGRQGGPNQQAGKQAGPAGVTLVPVSTLPDRYRCIWKFGVFNAIQSTTFDSVIMSIFNSDENVVVSAPTGSGKTVLFELAILRLFTASPDAKVVYLCPTRSLCSERARDWTTKFACLGWTVVELTGESSYSATKALGGASVIVTTPEKWDMVTRRWTYHRKVLDKLRLLLIDECHFVGLDQRGAVLEVVVSRMRTLGSDMRILALSATAPNIEDVADWLRSANLGDDRVSGAAAVFKFGDEYRACKLQKIVMGYPKGSNDWTFQSMLNTKLYELIKSYASKKPVLIFCNTRKGCLQAAQTLAKTYREAPQMNLPWAKRGKSASPPHDKDLLALADVGVAYHHAGLDFHDRRYVEDGFINGSICIVAATSTLAVGVNLPARMVIIKGTTQYKEGSFIDYSDADILQMLGRAGRPQFDTIGVACIMTDKDDERRFNALVKSETMLESCLHKTLTEHINSEITLRTITDLKSAERWLRGTFLYTRILKNPSHYALAGDSAVVKPELRLDALCLQALSELVREGIVDQNPAGFAATELGEIMSRYYLSLETFQLLRKIPRKATMRTLLETLAACSEFSSIRIRGGEKSVLVAHNKELKYPVAKITTNADKVMVVLQLILQCTPLADIKTGQNNPGGDTAIIWQHASRIVKAMVDLALERRDGGVRNALQLLRSVNSKSWDDTSYTLRQLDGIGIASLKTLAANGINSLRDVADTDHTKIELLLNRNPPFGRKVVAQARSFPRFTIDIKGISETPSPNGVCVKIMVEVGLAQTASPPAVALKGKTKFFASVCLTSSDGEYIEYRRMAVKLLVDDGPKSFPLTVQLVKPSQRIFASVSCDEIGGSEDRATYKPTTAASLYPLPALGSDGQAHQDAMDEDAGDEAPSKPAASKAAVTLRHQLRCKPVKVDDAPRKLPNGNYACRHKCKNNCRHLWEGLPKPPVPSRKKAIASPESDSDSEPLRKSAPKASSSKGAVERVPFPAQAVAAPRPRAPRPKPKPQPTIRPVEHNESSEDDLPTIDELLKKQRVPPVAPRRAVAGSSRAPLQAKNESSSSLKRNPRVNSTSIEISDDEDDEIDQLASPTPSPSPVARAVSARRATSAKHARSDDEDENIPGSKRVKSFVAPGPSPPPEPSSTALTPEAHQAATGARHGSADLPESEMQVDEDAQTLGGGEMQADNVLVVPNAGAGGAVSVQAPADVDEDFERWVKEYVDVTED